MFFPMYFDPTYIILIPAIIFTMYAQSKVKSTFQRYLQIRAQKGYTGFEVARSLLDRNGLRDVPIELSQGSLSDHYDPRNRVLRLSREVYQGNSIASVSVAAHEVGHAIQHAHGYVPLSLRNAIFPVASFGSSAAWIFIFAGFILAIDQLLLLGIYLFGAAVLFQAVTLPVEFNASSRAMDLLDSNGFVVREEYNSARRVLNAAALTYVAAMAVAVSQLIRLIILRNNRRR